MEVCMNNVGCVFDIETDGLIEECTKVHCLVVYDIEKDKMSSFVGDEIKDGLFLLKNFSRIIGHNIISFDLPILKKFSHLNLLLVVYMVTS